MPVLLCRKQLAPCSPSTTSSRPNDSLAPAYSALSGLRLWRIPFAASQATKVPHFVAEKETDGCGFTRAFRQVSFFSTENWNLAPKN